MTVGIGMPFSNSVVAALNALQNSMMLTPRWPNAGPIGGDGLAAPAGPWSLMKPVTFFAIFSHSIAGRGASRAASGSSLAVQTAARRRPPARIHGLLVEAPQIGSGRP